MSIFYSDIFLRSMLIGRISQTTIPDRKYFLILQLFYYCVFNNPSCEDLLSVWRSIPDPCFSESELCFLLGNVISSKMLRYVVNFYKRFIIEESDNINNTTPRPLLHLCRIAIRYFLNRNYQLPKGIYILGLPRLLRNYLNLKCWSHSKLYLCEINFNDTLLCSVLSIFKFFLKTKQDFIERK